MYSARCSPYFTIISLFLVYKVLFYQRKEEDYRMYIQFSLFLPISYLSRYIFGGNLNAFCLCVYMCVHLCLYI